jgi:release factor glutamine methyltransferase
LKNILEILNLSADYLKNKNVDEPRLSSELLISHALKIKRLDIYLQYDRQLTDDETGLVRELLKRRAAHEPVQYITGRTEFYGLIFNVDRSVLIPRPDTEILVEKVIELIGKREVKIFEIGTGSGCIAVSVAKNCPNAEITACDISDEALKTAVLNAKLNSVEDRIKFVRHDFLKDKPMGKFDLIISNPPYIEKTVLETLGLQVRKYEPAAALTDGGDGLAFYRRINDTAQNILEKDGLIILEIGYDQAEKVIDIYKKSFRNINILKDYSKNDRVVTGTVIN